MTPTEIEQRISEVILTRRAQLLEELRSHVAIPTGHNHTAGLDQYRAILADRLTAIGASIEMRAGEPRAAWLDLPAEPTPSDDGASTIAPIMVARGPEVSDSPRVLVAGHLDTVHDPHGPFREVTVAGDGVNATGPGVVDMKGGVLIAVTALEVLVECGIELEWTFMLNSDEERGSFHSLNMLREIAVDHDLGLVIEPALADGSLAVERMGSGQFKIEVFGQAAHVGREFTKGVSAVTALGEILGKLAAMADPDAGVIVNVGPLQGGGVTNAVPDHAACWGNVRFAGAAVGDRVAGMLDDLATPAGVMPRVVVHHQWNRPAKPMTDSVERLALAARAVAETLGQSLPFAATGGVCDGNVLQSVGLPTIDTLGVRGGNLHRPDEFIELDSLVERCQLLAVLMARLAVGGRAPWVRE